VALGVLLLSLLPLINQSDGACTRCGSPPPPWAYVLVLTQSLLLVIRRRRPFAVSLVVGLLAFAYGLSVLPDPPVSYAGLVALYTAAAFAPRPLARLAGVIAGVAIAVSIVVDRADADWQDLAVNWLVFATAWLLGDGAWTRRQRASEAEARAEAAERTRDAETQRAVAEERNRITREMHDIVAHHVSMMVVQAEAGPVVVERDPQRAVEAFDSISATGKQALTELRRLLGVLRSDDGRHHSDRLTPQPTLAHLPELVRSVRAAGSDVRLDIRGTAADLGQATDLSAYRIVQEALTNAIRHAGPARIDVRVTYGPESVDIEVTDDGVGSEARGGGGGHGLAAMRERAALVGGDVSAGPMPGGGWRVHGSLPYAVKVDR
jgi:signal transduction histidine kinase